MSEAQQRYRRLGKYEMHTLLGEGAMGIVWKAYDTVLRRYVALKLLSSSFRKTKDMQERFLREARARPAPSSMPTSSRFTILARRRDSSTSRWSWSKAAISPI